MEANSQSNNEDAGYSESNGQVVLPLAFLLPNAAELLEEMLAE